MEAQIYPPARVFVAPARVPRVLDTRDVSIADMREIAPAWAIVTAELPGIERMIDVGPLKVHLRNFSFRSLVVFGFGDVAAFDRIDKKLAALGEFK